MNWVFILLAPFLGALVYGLERVVRARMQRRIGPPILQVFYDMFKLMDKRTTIVNATHALLGLGHFLLLWLAVAGIFLGWNLLYVIFIHLFSLMMLVLAGYSVRSVYSHLGSNRELLALVAYEPVLILVAVGLYLQHGTFDIASITTGSSALYTFWPLFISLLMIVPIKLKLSPFDAADAHQEIVGGAEIEFSGVFYELVYMARCLEYLFVYALVFLFAGSDILLGVALVSGSFLLLNLVDNSTARVRIDHLLWIVYSVPTSIAVVTIFWRVL